MVLNRLSVIILEESLTLVKKSMDKFLHVASSFTYSSPISQTKPTATYIIMELKIVLDHVDQ